MLCRAISRAGRSRRDDGHADVLGSRKRLVVGHCAPLACRADEKNPEMSGQVGVRCDARTWVAMSSRLDLRSSGARSEVVAIMVAQAYHVLRSRNGGDGVVRLARPWPVDASRAS